MTRLLSETEPAAFAVEREAGSSPLFLTCDHASNRIPATLGTLGLSQAELGMHVAWDIGAAGVAQRLSERLDAILIKQNYSRLVIDCNRPPGAPESIVALSELTAIPGNRDLTEIDAARRAREVFWPYQERIRTALDLRARAGQASVLVSVHSFTPVFFGRARRWHGGLLYHRDPRIAHALLPLLRAEPGLEIGDNEPYAPSDLTDYTSTTHGEQRGIPHVGIEIRQDLIADASGQEAWAARLAPLLVQAVQLLGIT
jgi:predicted N-formylglutamate amidohydrolase